MLLLQAIQYIKGMDLLEVARDKIDLDKIIEFLNEKGHDHVSLFHRNVVFPKSDGTIPLYCVIEEARDLGSLEYKVSTKNDRELLAYSQVHWLAYELTKEQHLFMGVAWTIDEEFRSLELSSELFHVDETMCTKKEKYPLLTVTGKDRL